jgi:hypothetical protein
MQTKFDLVIAAALLMASVSTSSAREGMVPYDTLICQDKQVMNGFADVMRKTSVPGFSNYINHVIESGRCEKLVEGDPVSFAARNDGGSCLTRRSDQPCLLSIIEPDLLEAHAIATRVPPTTTGQGTPTTTGQGTETETTGSVDKHPVTTITKTTKTVVQPGQRPVTTTRITTETR